MLINSKVVTVWMCPPNSCVRGLIPNAVVLRVGPNERRVGHEGRPLPNGLMPLSVTVRAVNCKSGPPSCPFHEFIALVHSTII
jgi:hypothetical protein